MTAAVAERAGAGRRLTDDETGRAAVQASAASGAATETAGPTDDLQEALPGVPGLTTAAGTGIPEPAPSPEIAPLRERRDRLAARHADVARQAETVAASLDSLDRRRRQAVELGEDTTPIAETRNRLAADHARLTEDARALAALEGEAEAELAARQAELAADAEAGDIRVILAGAERDEGTPGLYSAVLRELGMPGTREAAGRLAAEVAERQAFIESGRPTPEFVAEQEARARWMERQAAEAKRAEDAEVARQQAIAVATRNRVPEYVPASARPGFEVGMPSGFTLAARMNAIATAASNAATGGNVHFDGQGRAVG